MQLQVGDILGHEWMGVVEDVGPEVKGIRKGDRVVASFQIACGECSFCKEGLSSMCGMSHLPLKDPNVAKLHIQIGRTRAASRISSTGSHLQVFLAIVISLAAMVSPTHTVPSRWEKHSDMPSSIAGGQAEYVRCPFADVNLLKIPDSVPDEKALFLSDIIPTSYHSTECAEVKEGKSVAIWGLGPVGLFAAKWSTIKKARRVIVIDRVPERLALAKSWGCETINFAETKDVVARIYELEPEGVDCSIDAAAFRYTKSILQTVQRAVGLETDQSEVVNEALRATRKFGNICLIADYAALTNGFLIGALMEKVSDSYCSTIPSANPW